MCLLHLVTAIGSVLHHYKRSPPRLHRKKPLNWRSPVSTKEILGMMIYWIWALGDTMTNWTSATLGNISRNCQGWVDYLHIRQLSYTAGMLSMSSPCFHHSVDRNGVNESLKTCEASLIARNPRSAVKSGKIKQQLTTQVIVLCKNLWESVIKGLWC